MRFMPRTKLTPQTIETIERLIDEALDGTPRRDAGNATGGISISAYDHGNGPCFIVTADAYGHGTTLAAQGSGPTVDAAFTKLVERSGVAA